MNVDLSTRYLGLKLKNPLGVSASPLTRNLDTLRRLEEAGTSVAVLPSLFEEQIRHEELEIQRLYEYQADSFAESLTYFPELEDYNTGPRDYLKRVEAAKRAVCDSHYRQLERLFGRRLGAVCERNPECRGRCFGAEYLFRADRPAT